jgi:hypothetical protein
MLDIYFWKYDSNLATEYVWDIINTDIFLEIEFGYLSTSLKWDSIDNRVICRNVINAEIRLAYILIGGKLTSIVKLSTNKYW